MENKQDQDCHPGPRAGIQKIESIPQHSEDGKFAPRQWQVFVQETLQWLLLHAREGSKEKKQKLSRDERLLLRQLRVACQPPWVNDVDLNDLNMTLTDFAWTMTRILIPQRSQPRVRAFLEEIYRLDKAWEEETLEQLEEVLVLLGADAEQLQRPIAW